MGKLFNPAGSRMNALEQCIKIENAIAANDDLAIQYKSFCWKREQSGDKFRKVAAQRLPSLGLQDQFITVSEGEAAKTIPLGLVEPTFVARNLFDGFCLCRRVRRLDGQM